MQQYTLYIFKTERLRYFRKSDKTAFNPDLFKTLKKNHIYAKKK